MANPNRPAEMLPEVAEAIRGALGQAIETPGGALVVRWAAVVEVADQDGARQLERICDPSMSGWDMRGFFHEGSTNEGWLTEPEELADG